MHAIEIYLRGREHMKIYKRCPKCGEDILEDAETCPYCE